MQVEEQHHEQCNSITHSPYYGCTVRVVSKARVVYEGVLDGISTDKDRIILKNVRVNANAPPSRVLGNDIAHVNRTSTSDALNAVMIDHLTNDIRIYEQVCLTVSDIEELRLIELPSTFHESKAKLRAIDPCLVDIRLSPSDEHETRSHPKQQQVRAPIARQKRGESFGSDGGSALVTSSSNESSSSFSFHSREKFTADESNDESMDEYMEQFRQLTIRNAPAKPPTLLAKKVLPRKIERPLATATMANQQAPRAVYVDNREPMGNASRLNQHASRKSFMVNQNRQPSPIRVTITSKLNPNAVPFYVQQRRASPMHNPSFTFYERTRFRPRLQPVLSPDRSQSLPYGMNQARTPTAQPPHQRFVPPRQMAIKQNFIPPARTHPTSISTSMPMARYRIHSASSLGKQSYIQPGSRHKPSSNSTGHGYTRQISLPTAHPATSLSPMPDRLTVPFNNRPRRSTASIHSTASLPYQSSSSGEFYAAVTPTSVGEPIGARRNQRTVSGASSSSSLSVDIGPHSIVQLDSPSNAFTSFEGQYDFEKANEEFRRYLELEELVTRRHSSLCSTISNSDDQATSQQQQQPVTQASSYKKEVSFFDQISCTATTGTAVGYTEMDETEKNLETFGDDALRMTTTMTTGNENEWEI